MMNDVSRAFFSPVCSVRFFLFCLYLRKIAFFCFSISLKQPQFINYFYCYCTGINANSFDFTWAIRVRAYHARIPRPTGVTNYLIFINVVVCTSTWRAPGHSARIHSGFHRNHRESVRWTIYNNSLYTDDDG